MAGGWGRKFSSHVTTPKLIQLKPHLKATKPEATPVYLLTLAVDRQVGPALILIRRSILIWFGRKSVYELKLKEGGLHHPGDLHETF